MSEVTVMNMLVGVLVEVIKTVSEIEREQQLGIAWQIEALVLCFLKVDDARFSVLRNAGMHVT